MNSRRKVRDGMASLTFPAPLDVLFCRVHAPRAVRRVGLTVVAGKANVSVCEVCEQPSGERNVLGLD